MFVIADCRHTVPSYLRNVGSDGKGYITVTLFDAIIFKSKTEADSTLRKIKNDGLFEFAVHELGIVR